MKYTLMILAAIITILIALFVKGQFKNEVSVKINNIYFKAEIAKTDQEKTTGLAKYKEIDNDFVMVFPYETPDFYTFWMKDMKFPIDIIYVRKNKIVDIFEDVPAPKKGDSKLPIIKPKEKSDSVFEINSGLSRRYKFKIGNFVDINY